MKYLFTFSFSLLCGVFLSAQVSQKVDWTYSASSVSDTEYDLVFTADVAEDWVIYSQKMGEGGPIPTAFTFESAEGVEFVGEVTEEGHRKEGFDELFGMQVIKLSGEVKFVQRVKVPAGGAAIKGYLTYMTCNGETCLPPTEVDFTFSIK